MALDNFIPKNAVKLCNKCKKRVNFTATCSKYPGVIPKNILFSNSCPDFEPKEETKQS